MKGIGFEKEMKLPFLKYGLKLAPFLLFSIDIN